MRTINVILWIIFTNDIDQMKKLIIIILTLSSIILAGCTTQTTTLSTSELFEKKKECETHIINAQSWEDKYYMESNTYKQRSEVLNIFYSKKLNSCLYVWIRSIYSINGIGNETVLYIKDALTYETVFDIKEYESYNTDDIINQKIQELKWE